MAIPVSASIEQLNAEVFLQEGFELSLDAVVPSIELTGSFTPNKSKTQFYIYNYSQTILYQNLNYESNGTYLPPENQPLSTGSNTVYNQFELNPIEDIYNQGYSSGNYYALYNFIDYELGSELIPNDQNEKLFEGYPYFIKDISGDRTELRIQNNFLNKSQIENYYQQFSNKINARENADEFYISFENNRNFIAVNSQLELPVTGSTSEATILIKLYNPLPLEFEENQELQIITKVGETQVFNVNFQPNLEFIDNLLSLKGPNYNVSIKDKVNNSTNYKTLKDLINTNSSASYYQFNSLRDQKGVAIRKNWGDWSQFVKYSSAEQRLNNFKDKLTSIEAFEDEILDLEGIDGDTTGSVDYSSSYNDISNNINQIISKFDSYEYFLYYVTGSESWPKYTSTYPYKNFSVSSSEAKNWFGSTNELDAYFNTGKNQIFSASIYDNNNQDYLYYLIPPFITDNSSNNQYIKFVNMTGQAFDEAYIYTEALEQVRNTNSSLTGSVLPLGLAADVVESLGFTLGGNDFNSIGFNPNGVGVFPSAGSGLEYISRYVDIASGSVINYYDQKQSTLGYVIALADPSFPYPIENSSQEIYKRIFHNMVSLVKRKGTVTGLRQLINIWGVPNTMLRISEFGGKNKDDENDYDLWMNRYSTAVKTYSGSLVKNTPSTLGTQASSSVLIPWTPLASNFYDASAPSNYFSPPDSIQFRFKNKKPIGSDQFFTSSLLIKPWFDGVGGNVPNSPGAFAIVLEYSGSNSGSFDGSTLPTDSQYGTLQLVMSGSVGDGAIEGTLNSGRHYFTSSKISLPFFNDGWWSVQLQRSTNLSASGQDNTLNEFELRVANNIYNGYDGNQIGFQGSASIQMLDGKISSSMNTAWNNMFFDNADNTTTSINKRALLLGGLPFDGDYGSGNNVIVGGGTGALKAIMKVGGKFIGRPFVGEYQEFRYYRRAVSASSFNDYVMNPESIQGHSDSNTGAGSSYDQLSYRISLGNELEFNNSPMGGLYTNFATGNYGNTKNQFKFGINVAGVDKGIGSIHPSIVNSTGELFTSSFIEYKNALSTRGIVTSSYYSWDIATEPDNQYITASWISPINEINYMDQPAAGLRNRIKNKIQVIDGNEYGTILSPFRSIQQEFEQSGSYTEDINSLEVGFSFQNEINDDIIGTFGHGVVSDAIADPRFISESSDRYPELTRIAEDYFKKYQGFNVNNDVEPNSPTTLVEKEYDYNRLIKFYETSLFKAIKNYVPARTSLSTGIIVKQHLLERNKTNTEIGININTEVATTPETGSNTFGPSSQTGFNSRIVEKNLLVTSSIGMYSLTGSAGGSVNKYNIITNEGRFYTSEGDNITLTNGAAAVPLFSTLPDHASQIESGIFVAVDYQDKVYFEAEGTFISQVRLNMIFTGVPSSATDVKLEVTSSKRGGIFETTYAGITVQDPPGLISDNYLEAFADERLYWNIAGTGATVEISAYTFSFGEDAEFTKPEPSSSQQAWFYIDDFTGEYRVEDTQDEFYNGEYSGSNFEVIPTQYNPYRIFADGNDKTSDTSGSLIAIDITQAESDANFASRTATGFTVGPNASPASGMITGSVFPHNSNFPLKVGSRYTVSFTTTGVVSGGRVGMGVYSLGDTGLLVATGNDIVTGDALFKQNTDPSAPAVGINGTFSFSFVYQGKDLVDSNGPGMNGSGIPPTYGAIVPFYVCPGAADEVVMSNITLVEESLGEKHLFPNDGFTIQPSQSQLFQNSPYNPIINNISGSRKNSYLFDMDFDPVISSSTKIEGIPSDYSLLVSASQLGWDGTATNTTLLEFAEVPDSNYTSLALSNPRYKGCLLESADYNFYTGIPSASLLPLRSATFGPTGIANTPKLLAQHQVKYINGETGSWEGDVSYGKNAVIDVHPINIAHFKQSYEDLSIFGTSTFVIDQLIQIPFEEILDQQSPIITSSLISGDNFNLLPVSSTFSPDRKASYIYNNPTKTFAKFNGTTLNYNRMKLEAAPIVAGATNWDVYWSNQVNPTQMSATQSFFRPSYTGQGLNSLTLPNANNIEQQVGLTLFFPEDMAPYQKLTTFPNLIQPDTPNNFPDTGSTAIALLVTGSSNYATSLGFGILNLRGPSYTQPTRPSNYNGGSIGSLIGPNLQWMNSINRCHIVYGDAMPKPDPTTLVGEFTYSKGMPSIVQIIQQAGGSQTDGDWGGLPVVPNSMGLRTAGINAEFDQQMIIPILDPDELGSFYRWDISGSKLTEYEQIENTTINIEPGDEIRVAYAIPQEILSGSSGGVAESIIQQDFQVIDYELAPPAVRTDTFAWAGSPSTFDFTLSGLITSSSPLVKNNPYQIEEYKRRLDIAIQNEVCFYWADNTYGAYTMNDIGSGSALVSAELSNYVVNLNGENRPTQVTVTVDKTKARDPNVPNVGIQWFFGTNNNGIIDKSLQFPLKSNKINSPYVTDGESVPTIYFLDPAFLFDRLIVSPDPSTLIHPIPSGSIRAATFRKRKQDDSKVTLKVNQPSGSFGIQTPSGDGYIVPNDLTDIQQRNVQKIINKLQSENVFQQNSPNQLD